jgi:hypothetical protein
LCEIEHGLFYVRYQTDAAKWYLNTLPTYQVGRSVADAMRRIEQAARALGFHAVNWVDML